MSSSKQSTSKSDTSDQKASQLLIKTLTKLSQEKSAKKSPKQTKSPARKRNFKPDDSHPKITSWLKNGENSKKKRKPPEIEEKLQPLNVLVADNEKKKSKKNKTLQRNRSFEKYGVAMPSFEKILDDHKRFQEHKENVKKFDVFDEKILSEDLVSSYCTEPEDFTGELLDCKHLAKSELQAYFQKFHQNLSDIINGKKYSDRHKKFHKGGSTDLYVSTSVVVFTIDQKECLIDLMKLEFDKEDRLDGYFFKVLLPELCLMIFMDVHKMGKKKALEYLDRRPLDF